MEKTICITVKDKIAQRSNDVIYTCGNSDYNIAFDFDEEWAEYETKTALFVYNGQKTPVVFTGNTCAVPVISNVHQIKVGVFSGNLHTTTPAIIYAQKSILCEGGTPADPPDDVYNQIMQRLNELGTPSPEAIAAAVADYIAANPIEEKDPTVADWAKEKEKPEYTANEVGAIAKDELQTAIDTALAQAKASGEFDGADGQPGADGKDGADGAPGADGKSAYAYAVEGGYTGTEEEFAAKLAEEMPETLPNPNALTFTGAVTGSYDGSEAVTVEIPSGGGGGGGSEWALIAEITSDGAGTSSGLYFPINFEDYKELHIEATSTADSSITFRLILSKITNWYDGQVITSVATSNAVAHMAHLWIVGGYIKAIGGKSSGYSDATCTFINSPRYAFATSDYAYIRFDANNSVVPEGATLKIWGVK